MSNIYTQTNEIANSIIHFAQAEDGTLTEVNRVSTGGKGTGGLSPVVRDKPVPDSLISANALISSNDRKLLFCVNAGDNTVSVFSVAENGSPELRDNHSTGNDLVGTSGTANSVAYDDARSILHVGHFFGPDQVRSFKLTDGKLSRFGEGKSVNNQAFPDRTLTQLVMSPDNGFLVAYVPFNAEPVAFYSDPQKADGTSLDESLVPADKDNVVVFPVGQNGELGDPVFSSYGVAPFAGCFLHGQSDQFVTVVAAQSGASLSQLEPGGQVTFAPLAKIDTTIDGKNIEPSEVCWISIAEDNAYAFGTNFGFGTVSVYSIHDGGLKVHKSEAAREVGDGTFRAAAGILTSGAGDSVVSGRYFYQLYANAAKIVGYRIEGDGGLTKVTEQKVPHNTTQGLARA